MRHFLKAGSWLYGGVLRCRRWVYRTGLRKSVYPPLPTISVGNLLVGGTGKTPFVHWLARFLLQQSRKPAILSRGYRRRSSGLLVVSDGQQIMASVTAAGDEPYWYAWKLPSVPVVVDSNRTRAAVYVARSFAVDTLILDDAFQHWQFHRHCDLVIVTSETLKEHSLLPAGRLREPLDALHRADLLLARAPLSCDALRSIVPERPCLPFTVAFGELQPFLGSGSPPEHFVAFAGIANPQQFFQQLLRDGVPVVQTLAFPDHHWYTPEDLRTLQRLLRQQKAAALVTTEKDAVRLLPYRQQIEQSGIAVYVLPMWVELSDSAAEQLKNLLEQCLSRSIPNRFA